MFRTNIDVNMDYDIDVEWDKKSLEEFYALEHSFQFQEFVTKIRILTGIPNDGFNVEEIEDNDEGDLFWPDDLIKPEYTILILRKIKRNKLIPPYLSGIVFDYILKGPDFKQSFKLLTNEGYGCSFEEENSEIILTIYNGALMADVISFIKKNWSAWEDPTLLRLDNKLEKPYRFKTRKSWKKYEDMIYLLDKKILSSSGIINKEKVIIFLKESGIIDPIGTPAELKSIGYDIQENIEARKKSIQLIKRLQKS